MTSRSRAFTAVEVMMALAVVTLGAMTVISIQKATLIANTNARNLASATEIAQAWVERMRIDALAWNYPSGPNPPDLSQTTWLNTASTTTGWFTPGTWAPGNQYPAGSPTADVMAADIYAGDNSTPAFCVQARLIQFGQNPTLWALARLMRVEVRVFWDKRGATLNCAAQTAVTLPSTYGAVYLVSGVLANNAPF